jgi:hypothetical protein
VGFPGAEVIVNGTSCNEVRHVAFENDTAKKKQLRDHRYDHSVACYASPDCHPDRHRYLIIHKREAFS